MKLVTLLGFISICFSSNVFAHPGHGLESVYAGFLHPITGWDHLLMMLAIGVWAAKKSGEMRWWLPVSFLLAMMAGVVLGFNNITMDLLEAAIASSVLAMGVILMVSSPLPRSVQYILTAIFGLLHGMAHGTELSHAVYPLLGMLLATCLLHMVGLWIGTQRFMLGQWLQRALALMMLLLGGVSLFS